MLITALRKYSFFFYFWDYNYIIFCFSFLPPNPPRYPLLLSFKFMVFPPSSNCCYMHMFIHRYIHIHTYIFYIHIPIYSLLIQYNVAYMYASMAGNLVPANQLLFPGADYLSHSQNSLVTSSSLCRSEASWSFSRPLGHPYCCLCPTYN